jgi:hypothetical protein
MQLSLGMSADLELAIAAGSTLVRIGSDLFQHLTPPPSAGGSAGAADSDASGAERNP